MNQILLYISSSIIFIWGSAHIIPTKSVVNSFNLSSTDNRLILTMEWVSEGLTLIFLGIIVFLISAVGDAASRTANILYIASAAMLFVMAVWSALTGARTSIWPMKICPIVKLTSAILIVISVLI